MHAYEMMDKQTWGLRTGSDDLNRAPETPATEPLALPLLLKLYACWKGQVCFEICLILTSPAQSHLI